jgi:uncharacterized protein YkwD
MKIFQQILIIVFVGVVLFFIKDDVVTVYNRTVTYLKDNKVTPSDFLSKFTPIENKINKITKSIITPGALVVSDNFLALGNNSINLSQKGVVEFTNKNRKENGGLVALKENAKLNASALKKLQDMFDKQYFEHVSPSGVGVADLGAQVSYTYIIIGENLALGNFKDDKSLVDAWMASPGHRANILNNKYTEIGVAVGKGMYEGRQTWMAVQHFGLPRSACPTVDEALLLDIQTSQKQIKSMESDLKKRRERIDSGAVYDGYTHNEQVDQYNQLVNQFNKLIVETKQKTTEYNNQIRLLNSCIESNTKG